MCPLCRFHDAVSVSRFHVGSVSVSRFMSVGTVLDGHSKVPRTSEVEVRYV